MTQVLAYVIPVASAAASKAVSGAGIKFPAVPPTLAVKSSMVVESSGMEAITWECCRVDAHKEPAGDPRGKKRYLFAEAMTGAEVPFNLEICEITF